MLGDVQEIIDGISREPTVYGVLVGGGAGGTTVGAFEVAQPLAFVEGEIRRTGQRFVISFGEERPLEAGQNERSWVRNRRAEFQVSSGNVAGGR